MSENIVIATKNKGKILEIRDFFKGLDNIDWLTFEDFNDFPEVKEGNTSFLENAGLKAKSISEFTGMRALADDSGLQVDALGGAPGVTSSRYAGPDADDSLNRKKLLSELAKIKDISKRTARFICSMMIWEPGKGQVARVEGICEGHISFEEKGSGGFGYDSIFIPQGYDLTMAQLSSDEKNMISHRAKALKKLLPVLSSRN